MANLTDSETNSHTFTNDVHWYKDTIYIVRNTTKLVKYNISSHESIEVEPIKSISNVVIEWITKKMYWSDPKRQIVSML